MKTALTPRERVLFNRLKTGTADTSELLQSLKKKGIDTKSGHHAMTVALKYLSSKICQEGWIIRRIQGGQGRGNVAKYHMEKEF